MPISAAMPSTQPNTPAGIPNPASPARREQVEARLGRPAVHEHEGGPQVERHGGEAQGSSVVQRTGHEVGATGLDAEGAAQLAERESERDDGQSPADQRTTGEGRKTA